MRFRLHYRGPLKSNGNPRDKQALRRKLSTQLKELWNQAPLVDQRDEFLNPCYELSVIKKIGDWNFASVVDSRNNLVAELDITLLRPEEPGSVITKGGDIDNRLKTLLDALSIPQPNQIPADDTPGADEDPFHCLLEDDNLITSIRATVDRLLDSKDNDEVIIVMSVNVSCTRATLANLGLSL